MQINDAVAIALEGDIAAVLGHGRAHARLEQLLDGLDGLFVLGREEFVLLRALRGGSRAAAPVRRRDNAP